MADYFWGKLEFPAAMIDAAVTKALEAEGVEMDNLAPSGHDDDSAWIENGIFTIEDSQARYGQFEDLENLLRQKGIPFDRQSGQAYEFYPELVIFRPGENGAPALSLYLPLVGSSDKPGIIAQDIKDLIPQGIEAIQAYLDEHVPNYPPLGEYVKED
jgi:hypothetical protein